LFNCIDGLRAILSVAMGLGCTVMGGIGIYANRRLFRELSSDRPPSLPRFEPTIVVDGMLPFFWFTTLRVSLRSFRFPRAWLPMMVQLVLLLSGASVSALRQPIGRITSLNRNRLVADEADGLFYRSPRLVNHADGATN